MRPIKLILRIVLAILTAYFLIWPSITLLFLNKDFKTYRIEHIESYKEYKGVVLNVEKISGKQVHINYDKDVFENVYGYTVKDITDFKEISFTELVKKNTYFFEELRPSHAIGDTVSFYKSRLSEAPILSDRDYKFQNSTKNGNGILWLSVIILMVGAVAVFWLLRPILKMIKT